jgi:Family of unknown function (DUF6492)
VDSIPAPYARGLTFVTVVFGAEFHLLQLQARSLARFLDPEVVASIIVIDNGWTPLTRRQQSRLSESYGIHAAHLRIMRSGELIGPAPATSGWRTQQIAKLMVSKVVQTPWYVILDAKNHLIRSASDDDFLNRDGRGHGGTHPYSLHPLKSQLESTLSYLGTSPAQIAAAVRAFPPTTPPFVMNTQIVRSMIAAIERDSGGPFAIEFEAKGLLEFFLYSGWLSVRGPGFEATYDGTSIPSPTVWPKVKDVSGVDEVVAEAEAENSAFFAVHRTILARGDAPLRDRVFDFWVSRGLFVDSREARKFIRGFRRSYLPQMITKKLFERISRAFSKVSARGR